MDRIIEMYESMGISSNVYHFGEEVLKKLADRFAEVDRISEYNQAKVLSAMQKNRVSAACFAARSLSARRCKHAAWGHMRDTACHR